MRDLRAKLGLLVAFVILASLSPSSALPVVDTGQGPALASIGPLAFGPDGTLFAADNQGAAIFALDLGAQVNGGAPGAKALDALDEKLAALLGTGAREVSVTDLAVHPRTRNAYVSVMRGQEREREDGAHEGEDDDGDDPVLRHAGRSLPAAFARARHSRAMSQTAAPSRSHGRRPSSVLAGSGEKCRSVR